jgi:AraC family ethanolamine operon transcriptional activator
MAGATFHEFEAYEAAIEDVDVRITLPRLGVPIWNINTCTIGGLHVQFGREGSGTIAEGSSIAGGQVVFVPISGGHRANGVVISDRSVFIMQPRRDFTISVHEAHDWCSVFIPWHLAGVGETRPAAAQVQSCRVVDIETQQIFRLRWVLSRLARAIETEPRVLTEPLAAGSIRQDLLAVCRFALVQPPCDEMFGRPRLSRQDLLQTVRALIDEHLDDGLTIEDLTSVADVSERTLRSVFLEYFGLPPMQYLLARRLHRVRNALQAGAPAVTTVTAVAAKFGFWHFGRFAGQYRRLFGESPSATLSGKKGAYKKSLFCMGQ